MFFTLVTGYAMAGFRAMGCNPTVVLLRLNDSIAASMSSSASVANVVA
jgi:hypothetical protein